MHHGPMTVITMLICALVLLGALTWAGLVVKSSGPAPRHARELSDPIPQDEFGEVAPDRPVTHVPKHKAS